jgi:hypothetical protein
VGVKTLKQYEKKYYSQQGEDGVLEEVCFRVFDGNIDDKHIFEFGASTGIECNSRYFILEHGWHATLIEASENAYTVLRAMSAYNPKVTTLKEKVTPDNIQALLDKCEKEVDVLSIDIDSQDYWVWEAVTSSPKVVVVEYNADLRGSIAIKKGLDLPFMKTTAYGASLEAFIKLGKRKGYTLVHTESNGVNAFFVRNDLAYLFPEKESPQLITKNVRNFLPTTEDVFVEV